MRRKIAATAGALVAVTVGTGAAVAASSDDESVTGPRAEAATSAALEATGGGQVSAVERESESGVGWEVEVTRPDGSIAEVSLDEKMRVVAIEVEDARDDGDDEPDDLELFDDDEADDSDADG